MAERYHELEMPVLIITSRQDHVVDPSDSEHLAGTFGGSVEHMNEEPGALWLRRVTDIYKHAIWLNPLPEAHWGWTPSITLIVTASCTATCVRPT